jgi:hypothetical protein
MQVLARVLITARMPALLAVDRHADFLLMIGAALGDLVARAAVC